MGDQGTIPGQGHRGDAGTRSGVTVTGPEHMTRPLDAQLLAHPLFLGMSRQDVELLADCALTRRFGAGEVIFHQGEEADRLYLVESGSVALEAGGDAQRIVLENLGPGELLGLSWLFPPHKWRVTARTVQPALLVFFNGELLRRYAERDRSLGFQLYKRFTEVQTRRLQQIQLRLTECAAPGSQPAHFE